MDSVKQEHKDVMVNGAEIMLRVYQILCRFLLPAHIAILHFFFAFLVLNSNHLTSSVQKV